jgi:hypothetical protein
VRASNYLAGDAADAKVMRKVQRAPTGLREESLKAESFFSKVFHPHVCVKTLLACTILLCGGAVSSWAQDGGIPVGGKWWEFDTEDKMTLAKKAKFVLSADNFLRDSTYQKPKIEVVCINGKLENSFFNPNVRLGPPNRPGFWGQPQAVVLVRVDDSHDTHGWNWVPGHALSMDKGTTRKLFRANVFKVEFRSAGGPEIAEFSPSGIYTDRVSKACGFNPK